jgi:hypothetical protein
MFPDIEAIEAKAKQQGFDSLSKEERIVFVIAEAEFEIILGGVWGYLHNSSGARLAELIESLSEIDATELAETGKLLLNKISEYCCAKNREERILVLHNHENELADLIDDFSKKFQNHDDEWGDKLHKYFNGRHYQRLLQQSDECNPPLKI